jgi:hypothetical protein
MITETQAKIDGAIAVGSVTAPWWLELFNQASHVYFIVGGAILLTLRIALAVRDWRRR